MNVVTRAISTSIGKTTGDKPRCESRIAAFAGVPTLGSREAAEVLRLGGSLSAQAPNESRRPDTLTG
jgi:hypothetical protein